MTCLFCLEKNKRISKNIIGNYSHCYVIYDEYPVSPGHLLIISKEHVQDWFSASINIQNEFIEILDKMKKMLAEKFHPDGFNIGLNCGKAAGQTVMHLHMHLIPRYFGDIKDPKGGVRGVIPQKRKYTVN